MLTSEQQTQFNEEGFIILPALFDAAEVDALRERIETFVAAHEAELQRRNQNEGISRANEISFTQHLAEQDAAIMQFVSQEKILDLAVNILGPDVSLYWDQAVYKKPETQRDFPWHQDNGYAPVDPEAYLTCWLALEDVSVQNGCVWVLPRTHTQGTVEHKDTPIGKQCYFGEDKGVPVELKKGGLVIFSSLLFHRSGPNLSDTIRKGYIVQYTPAHVKDGRTGEPLNRPLLARAGAAV